MTVPSFLLVPSRCDLNQPTTSIKYLRIFDTFSGKAKTIFKNGVGNRPMSILKIVFNAARERVKNSYMLSRMALRTSSSVADTLINGRVLCSIAVSGSFKP